MPTHFSILLVLLYSRVLLLGGGAVDEEAIAEGGMA